MKLRNKVTGLLGELKDFINDGFIVKVPDGRGVAGYKYDSLTALNKEWEDYKPIESSKCYLINEETGYIITFDNKHEMEVFRHEVNGWKQVKVILNGEKYFIERIRKEAE